MTHTVASADSDYQGAAASDVSVTITDDDSAGVTVTPTTLTIEEGATSTYTVVLDSEPTATTTVTVNDPSNTDVTADPESLTFTTESWDTEQTVTVTVGQDEDSTDDTATVTHTVASADSDYQGAAASDVSVTVTDDDHPAVSVRFGQGAYSATEGGGVEVSVILSVAPERRVVVPLTRTNQHQASDADYLGVPDSVTFESVDTEKRFTLTAIDDDVDDDGESVKLTFGDLPDRVTEGSVSTTTVSIIDNDTAGVTVTPTALTIDEGATSTYTVVLDTEPTATTTVTVNDPSNTDVTADPESLTFTTESWDTEQTVTITAGQDEDSTEDTATVTHTVSGGDYGSVSASDVTVTVTDGDTAGVTVTPTALTIDEGATSTYTVVLDTEPTATTTVTVNDPSNTDVTADPESLTFTTESWDTEQTVTVTVGQDEDSSDDTATVTHTVASADSDYQGAAASDVSVTVTDDDHSAVSVSFGQATYSATEGGSVEVSVTLSVAPERRVVVPLTRTNQHEASDADYSGVPDSVTFESVDTEKSFTLTAIDDDVDDDGESVKLTFGSLPPGVSGGATTETIVTISDNDEPAPIRMPMVTLKVTPSVIEEQGGSRASAAIVTASLDRLSAADTMVTISTDPSAATWFALSENKELTIPAGDSTSTGMVTITAMNGDDFGDYQVLTVEGTARNNGGANGPDPVTLTVFAKDAGVIPYAENGTGPVMTFTSTDPENGQPGEGIDWDVTGVDADGFLIDHRGMLMFRRPPDFEDPTDRARSADDTDEAVATGSDNMYQVTVRATEQMAGDPDHRALSAETRVTVMVIDVNEPGRLMMNRLQPEVGTPITAILSDPDGDEDTDGVVGSGDDEVTLGWQWYASKVEDPVAHSEGHWTAATGTGNNTATYTPAGDRVTDDTSTAMDEGRYLRVVVKYLDMGVKDTDDGVTVRMVREEVAVSVNPVREEMSSDLDGVGNTENGSPGFSPADSYTRTVPENSPGGTPIGDPVVAVDPNDDTLTYELDDDMDAGPADRSGDVGHFSIDMATGHITVEKRLDYEDNADGYEFYVRAIDPSGETAEVMVTVIASDANDAP